MLHQHRPFAGLFAENGIEELFSFIDSQPVHLCLAFFQNPHLIIEREAHQAWLQVGYRRGPSSANMQGNDWDSCSTSQGTPNEPSVKI